MLGFNNIIVKLNYKNEFIFLFFTTKKSNQIFFIYEINDFDRNERVDFSTSDHLLISTPFDLPLKM